MPSTHRTQLRLHQVSGSLNSSAPASANLGSAQDILDQMARSLKEIRGTEFTSADQTSKLKDADGQDRLIYLGSAANTQLLSADGANHLTLTDAGMATFSENLTVTGNLTVNGTTTTIDTENAVFKDQLIGLNNGVAANMAARDSGIIIQRHGTNEAAVLTITVTDGDATTTAKEGQRLSITDHGGTTKNYIIVNSVGGGVATGTVLAADSNIGSRVVVANESDLIGGIAVQVDLSSGTQRDVLVQLKAAIEATTDHQTRLEVGEINVAEDGNQSLTISNVQNANGSIGASGADSQGSLTFTSLTNATTAVTTPTNVNKLVITGFGPDTATSLFLCDTQTGDVNFTDGAAVGNGVKICENGSGGDINSDSAGFAIAVDFSSAKTASDIVAAVRAAINTNGTNIKNAFGITGAITAGAVTAGDASNPATFTASLALGEIKQGSIVASGNKLAGASGVFTAGGAALTFTSGKAQIDDFASAPSWVNAGGSPLGNVAAYYDEGNDAFRFAYTDQTPSSIEVLRKDQSQLKVVVDALHLSSTANDRLAIDASGDLQLQSVADLLLQPDGGQVKLKANNLDASELQFFSGSNSIGLKAPQSLGSSTDFTLPSARPGSGIQALMVNSSDGVMSFQEVPDAAAKTKQSLKVLSKITADEPADIYDAAFNLVLPAAALNGTEVPDANVMAFVNGQLIMSGSGTEVTNGEADYRFEISGNTKPSINITPVDDSSFSDDEFNNLEITIPVWQAKEYQAVEGSGGSLEISVVNDGGNGFIGTRRTSDGSTPDQANNIQVGDIIEIRKAGGGSVYRRVIAAPGSNKFETSPISSATADAIAGVAVGDDLFIAAKVRIIHFDSSTTSHSIETNNGTSGATSIRSSLVVGIDDTTSVTDIATRLQAAITANPSIGLGASRDGAKVTVTLDNVVDDRANTTLVTSTANSGNQFTLDASDSDTADQFKGGTTTGNHTLSFAFDLEVDDIVTLVTR